jgi:hypothetical protein
MCASGIKVAQSDQDSSDAVSCGRANEKPRRQGLRGETSGA